jgi:choline dehydrogenase-like flavoprotein
MSAKIYDVVVVGTGAGGGMAIKTLTDAGLNVCAINPGPKPKVEKNFRNHRRPYEMKFRGFDDPRKNKSKSGYLDNEYVTDAWEDEIPFTVAEGSKWVWPRSKLVGGKTNFWGRSSCRFSDIDFKAASRDGVDVDWPVDYAEMAPYYSRVEKMIGVASTIQNRPSHPDGEFLPAFKFRCVDRIVESGAKKVGVPYLPDRIAQLTTPLNGFPKCHFCGSCWGGCETGSFFSSSARFIPSAEKSGRLELRTDTLAKSVLIDESGQAKGVLCVDRKTKKEFEVLGRAVVLAASCPETTRIMLNSKSERFPNGVANSSGQLGKNLCDHLYGTTAFGYLPQLVGAPSLPDNVSSSTIAWMPRWQNLKDPFEEKFVRGYSMYPDGGTGEFPGYHDKIQGFGSQFKKDIKRFFPSPLAFYCQVPSLPSATNYVDLDPTVKDPYGIPVARFHFKWGANELKMWEHAKQVSAKIFKASGAVQWGSGEPSSPGFSLHESGTARMGNDPKKFVTSRFGHTHDVPNLYLCDASVFLSSTDKTTTLSIMAFALRASEHLARTLSLRTAT